MEEKDEMHLGVPGRMLAGVSHFCCFNVIFGITKEF